MTDLEERLRRFDAPLQPPALPDGDVSYALHDTAVGRLVLAVDRDGAALACSYDTEEEVLGRLARTVSPAVLRAPHRLDDLRRQLDEYLAGRRTAFDVPLGPLAAGAFGRRVLLALRDVPYGATTSYGRLAGAVGAPRAGRAVGTALGANPVCLLLPCHRVVRADGSVGGYAGGPDAKAALLALEAATAAR